jgi:hypothetical protein
MDHSVAESLLSGAPRPEEPPELRRVRALLGAAAHPAPAAFTSRDDRTIARMIESIESADGTPAEATGTRSGKLSLLSTLTGSRLPRRRLLKTKLVGGLAVMTFLAGTGLAFAGALPGEMQDTASHLLQRVGVHVPEGGAPAGLRHVGPLGDDAGAGSGGSAVWTPIPRSITKTGAEKGGRTPHESGDQSGQGGGVGSGSGDQGDGSSGSSGGGGDQGSPGAGDGSGSGDQGSQGGDGQG